MRHGPVLLACIQGHARYMPPDERLELADCTRAGLERSARERRLVGVQIALVVAVVIAAALVWVQMAGGGA